MPVMHRASSFPNFLALSSMAIEDGTAIWILITLTATDDIHHMAKQVLLQAGATKNVDADEQRRWKHAQGVEDDLRNTVTSSRYLCVMNDGTRFLSRMVRTTKRRIVIVCDMKDQVNLEYYRGLGKEEWYREWMRGMQRKILDSSDVTEVGVKLYDTRLICDHPLFREFFDSLNSSHRLVCLFIFVSVSLSCDGLFVLLLKLLWRRVNFCHLR